MTSCDLDNVGPGNGLLSIWYQSITLKNVDFFCQPVSVKFLQYMYFKMPSAKFRPFCSSFNVLDIIIPPSRMADTN